MSDINLFKYCVSLLQAFIKWAFTTMMVTLIAMLTYITTHSCYICLCILEFLKSVTKVSFTQLWTRNFVVSFIDVCQCVYSSLILKCTWQIFITLFSSVYITTLCYRLILHITHIFQFQILKLFVTSSTLVLTKVMDYTEWP